MKISDAYENWQVGFRLCNVESLSAFRLLSGNHSNENAAHEWGANFLSTRPELFHRVFVFEANPRL